MKNGKTAILMMVYVVIGAVLIGLGYGGVLDHFWGGMGAGIIAVGLTKLVQLYRVRKDDSYREKVEIESTDERNCFIQNKALAWAGNIFIITASISAIVLKLVGQELLALGAGAAVCVFAILYFGCYLVLRKKY